MEIRVACPLCGGLIHPVAGRCKHCKQDLATFRAGRPQAAAALPALGGGLLQPSPLPEGHGRHAAPEPPNPYAPSPIAQVASAGAPAFSAVGVAREASAPILPPRPTGRSYPAAQPSGWRNWPVVVIGLAALAIIAAVAIMVWPAAKKDRDPSRALQPPPAPEKMDSDPLPPPGAGNANGADPWANGHSQADPQPPHRTPDPLPPHAANPPDPDDPTLPQLKMPDPQQLQGAQDMLVAVVDHACKRLKTCQDVDDMAKDLCDMFAQMPHTTAPTCAAAQQCLEQIDKLDCTQAATTTSLLSTIPVCFQAETSC